MDFNFEHENHKNLSQKTSFYFVRILTLLASTTFLFEIFPCSSKFHQNALNSILQGKGFL